MFLTGALASSAVLAAPSVVRAATVITSLPFVGVAWEKYRLDQSLTYGSTSGVALRLSHYSSLDWNGCSIIFGSSDASVSNAGLFLDGEGIEVNGYGGAAQFAIGIQQGLTPGGGLYKGTRIRNTKALRCRFRGFLINAEGYTVDDCLATDIGGSTNPAWQESHTFGFEFLGSGIIRRSKVHTVYAVNGNQESVAFCVNDRANPVVFEDNIATNPTVLTKSIGYFFGSDQSQGGVHAIDNKSINFDTGLYWKLPNSDPSPGTPGTYQGNTVIGATLPYRHGPLVSNLGGNV